MANEPILIIDDNALNLELITYLLTMHQYDVHTAASSNEAIKTLKTFQPLIILTDLQLPDIDGIELIQKLKADEKYKHIPIIAITARAMKGDKEKALAVGCDEYITKPIDVKTLPGIVGSYLRKKK